MHVTPTVDVSKPADRLRELPAQQQVEKHAEQASHQQKLSPFGGQHEIILLVSKVR